ncbi:MAG: BatA domain-containing protein [Bacteroidetes bacterium]|nr:BatA domain-containing protein [Bacteroidota bacterium]
MGFINPFFLFAGLALALPLAIHLFNLRRYKRVYFPHSRFLRSLQLRSRRSSQLRYKLLLVSRILFLAVLVLAFAQPFLHDRQSTKTGDRLQVIYIDNNPAMGLEQGIRSGLGVAIDAAREQIKAAAPGSPFILLNNDKAPVIEPESAEKVLATLSQIHIAPVSYRSEQVFARLQALMQAEGRATADLYYYSNFPQGNFSAQPAAAEIRGIRLHAIAVQPRQRSNIYIDTAFLNAPVLQSGAGNSLVIRTKRVGKATEAEPVMQLAVNGQVKSAASIRFDEQGRSSDTLHFSVSETGWQRIQLALNDASLHVDDSFRIAARSAPSLSVLVLNQTAPSPYLLAAFRSYAGFDVRSERLEEAPSNWRPYNLIILNGITRMPEAVGQQVQQALAAGKSVCLFPGKSTDFSSLNAALAWAGDVRVTGLDTVSQAVASLQRGADIVKNVFENIPENVQLPVANWHFDITSEYSANGQNILSFRNGSPLLARYSSGPGSFYLGASSADIEGGNFPASYFFVPFLYQMALQSSGGAVYALSAGEGQSAFMPLSKSGEQNMVHLIGPGLDAIPPQRVVGGGVDVFVDAATEAPGFYQLAAPSGDTALIALNGTRAYSGLAFWDMEQLRARWPDKNASWQTPESAAAAGSGSSGALPLWKVCVILALVFLAAETGLLIAGRQTKTTYVST